MLFKFSAKNWENETGTKELTVRSVKVFQNRAEVHNFRKKNTFYICKVWSKSNPLTTNFLEKYYLLGFLLHYPISLPLPLALSSQLLNSGQTWLEKHTNIYHIKFVVFWIVLVFEKKKKKLKVNFSFTALTFFFWFFLGLHPGHMAVPRLGV